MRALQYTSIGRPPEVVEIPTPEPGPGEILLKVTAAGAGVVGAKGADATEIVDPTPFAVGSIADGEYNVHGQDVAHLRESPGRRSAPPSTRPCGPAPGRRRGSSVGGPRASSWPRQTDGPRRSPVAVPVSA